MKNNAITQPIIHCIAKILQELHLDFSDFSHALREDYTKTVYNNCQQLRKTALLCGIDRRTTDAILKGHEIKHSRAILLIIIEAVQMYLDEKNQERKSFNLDTDMTMAKYGNNSIDTIVKTKANGSTSTITVLKTLVHLGIIKDIGPKFRFLGYPPPQTTARNKVTTVFSQKLDVLVNDYVQQMQSVSRLYGDSDNT